MIKERAGNTSSPALLDAVEVTLQLREEQDRLAALWERVGCGDVVW